MKPKKGKIISNILFLLSIVVWIIGIILIQTTISTFVFVIGILIFLAHRIFLILFWKCQSCNKRLPYFGLSPIDYCPYCGDIIE